MTKPQNHKQETLLQLAETLYGEERIRAYTLAGRSDLARNHANELLIGEGFNYGRGPQSLDPFSHDNWEVLRMRKKFDERGISYDLEAVKKGVRNTYCFNLYSPYQERIQTINTILEEHDLTEEERKEFFARIRDRARHDIWVDETGDFVFRLKETEYSALAAHTGIPRKEVVGHYLDNLFRTERANREIDTIGKLLYTDDLELRLWQFMQKENVEGEEIVSRTIKVVQDYVQDYRPKWDICIDHKSRPYRLVDRLSRIPTVKFPKDFAIRVLKDYVTSGNMLDETFKGPPAIISFTDMQEDPLVLELRREAILREIEQGYMCLVKRADYAINNLGIDPTKGRLRTALSHWVKKYKKSTYPSETEELLRAGKKYDLLSQEEIEKLEEKLTFLKKIKNND